MEWKKEKKPGQSCVVSVNRYVHHSQSIGTPRTADAINYHSRFEVRAELCNLWSEDGCGNVNRKP